jgi:type IV pilus assembly protein PilO
MKVDITDLTFENIDRWPVPIKILVIAVIFLLIVAFGYWFDNKQQLVVLDTAKQREQELKQTFRIKQQLAANYQAYKDQLAEIKQTFGTMLRQLPSTTEVPGLLEDISQAGIASGLTFRLFKPQPEVKHEFYTELPIQIQVVGTYHQLAEFVSKIVGLDRIVTLHDISIARAGIETDGNLIMDITAKTYSYTETKDGQ